MNYSNKNKILIMFYFFMNYLGVIQLFFWLNRKKRLVLTYHNIIPDNLFDESYHLGVSHCESVFKKQIQLIAKRFNKKKFNRCLITFDDGYKNQSEIASKTLNHYDLTGLFFISFQLLTTGCALTIDRIMMWLSYVPVGEYKIMGHLITLDDHNRSLIGSEIYEQLMANYKLWDEIENELDRAFSFNHLSMNPQLSRLRFEPLTVVDLKTLINAGHSIGTHSWNHRPLSQLPIEVQKEDFLKCSTLVKKYCNSLLYSYPFGSTQEVSPLTAQLCEEYGFHSAYMNVPESPKWLNVKANFIFPRLNLPNESNRYLINAKLSGFEMFCKKNCEKLRKFIFNH